MDHLTTRRVEGGGVSSSAYSKSSSEVVSIDIVDAHVCARTPRLDCGGLRRSTTVGACFRCDATVWLV